MTSKKMININGDETDPFYRYKMPEVNVKSQCSQYAFTNVDNICSVKGGIGRCVGSVQKFLNKNLHTNFVYKNNCLLTSAPITKKQIQDIIFLYINKFILCTKCNSPETIVVNEKKKEYNKCNACGNYDEVTIDGVIRPKNKKNTEKCNIVQIDNKNIEKCDIVQIDNKNTETNLFVKVNNDKKTEIDQELEDLINGI